MAKQGFESVKEYIAQQPKAAQPVLRRVCSIIRKAIPGAEEIISYNMPTYTLHGVAAVYLAGWKQHYSMYPATDELLEALEEELAPYKVHKGTIRFEFEDPIPAELIERIAKLRAKAAKVQAAAKPARTRTRTRVRAKSRS
ncbi:MAG TPA: DUF1801 domain-containing protein [Polyangiales bacterium]|nr:DUF1801 domain-containing protein [Polyangiales bacterium]